MKTLSSLLLGALLITAAALPRSAPAQGITIDFFYNPLSDYGRWVDLGGYGYVWHPDVADDWSPYTDGHWVYTDAGWTWMSDEPYGWAVYHYGRWLNVLDVGWVWVPDTEWGPAWVSWRRSPTYVGWAPLPPEAHFRRNIGFANWVDAYFDIGPSYYRFIEMRRFGAPNVRSYIVEPSRNIAIIRNSTNITRITYANDMVVNRGPDFEAINRVSAEPIRRLRLDRQTAFQGDPRTFDRERFRTRQEGDALRVFAPAIAAAKTAAAPPRVDRHIERAEINRGWRGPGIAEAQARELREKFHANAEKVPDALPPKPTFQPATLNAEAQTAADSPNTKTDANATTKATAATTPTEAGKMSPAAQSKTQAEGKSKNATTSTSGETTESKATKAGQSKESADTNGRVGNRGKAKGENVAKGRDRKTGRDAAGTGESPGANATATSESKSADSTTTTERDAGRGSKSGGAATAKTDATAGTEPGTRAATARADAAQARSEAMRKAEEARRQGSSRAEEVRRATPSSNTPNALNRDADRPREPQARREPPSGRPTSITPRAEPPRAPAAALPESARSSPTEAAPKPAIPQSSMPRPTVKPQASPGAGASTPQGHSRAGAARGDSADPRRPRN